MPNLQMLKEHHKATVEVIKKAAYQGLGPASLFATIAGFFSDFVKPLINLVPFFLVISLLTSLVLWFGFIAKGKKVSEFDTIEEILKSKFGIFFGVMVLSTAFWLLMVPVFAVTPQDGVVATVVPQASELQGMMMARFDKIDQKLDKGFEAVLQKIDQIDKGAGLIGNPSSYNDYYHNAKIHELGGNLLEARKSYEKYFETNLSYFDPFLSYANIVKALEGPGSVSEYLGKIRDQYPENPAAALIYAVNKNREDKLFLLDKLAVQYPDYGPIFYYIVEANSASEGIMPTLAEQKKAQEALAKLEELEKTQGFSNFFIDKEALATKEAFIKAQKNMGESYYGQLVKNPIDFKYEYVNGSVSLTFVPMEMVKEIFYRIDGQGEFKSTGMMGINMPGSAQSLPNYSVIEPLKIGKHKIEIKYRDSKDQLTQPASFDFEITPVRLNYMGYQIMNPKTGKAGPYIYYNFYETRDSEAVLKYSIDNQNYDQIGDGMIFLDGLTSGEHELFYKTTLGDGVVYENKLQFKI
ncbi:hypothetical protein IT412_02560 [Candidatus Peregrinibacteria bacterium]|nr:hypothetical protein [Candidatus Peregrinibacteria bacterium]